MRRLLESRAPLAVAAAALFVLGCAVTAGLLPFKYWTLWDGPRGWSAFITGDFVQIWAAGEMMLKGLPTAPYVGPLINVYIKARVGADAARYIWAYPPPALLLVLPFGLLPIVWSFCLYVAAQGLAFLRALKVASLGRGAALLCLLSPAAVVSVVFGQNGMATASFALPALLLSGRSPYLAGFLAGCLVWKPQAAVMIPICFLAAGARKAFTSAALTSLTLVIGTALAFGTLPWRLWFSILPDLAYSVDHVDKFVESMASPLAAMLTVGVPARVAHPIQAVLSFAAAVATWVVWRRECDHRLKVAFALCSSVIAAPYVFVYDMPGISAAVVLTAVSIGFSRIEPWERLGLVFCWTAPTTVLFVGMLSNFALTPLLPSAVSVAAFIVWRRTRPQRIAVSSLASLEATITG